MLLNIDKPLRTATLHSDTCSRVPVPYETEYKKKNKLGRDGGWFTVDSEDKAKALAQSVAPQTTLKRCKYCLTE